jgi:tetratricopeptide (TPR) repeat protein
MLGCGSVRNTAKQQEAVVIKPVNLNQDQQRKFDYFFFEANREKMKGNIEKTVMYYNECLKIDPTSGATLFELANIYAASNALPKAQGFLERAVTIYPNNVWYKLLLAELYQRNSLGEQAIKIYEELVGGAEKREEFLYGLAQLYHRNGFPERAIETYDKLEKEIGLNEIVSIEKEKLYLEIGKNKNALNEIERLIKKYPSNPTYYGFRADYYRYLKDYNNALMNYETVLELEPDNGLAYFSMAEVYIIQKDTLLFTNFFKKGLQSLSTPFEVKMQKLLPLVVEDASLKLEEQIVEDFFNLLVTSHKYEANALIYYGNYKKTKNEIEEALKLFKRALNVEPNNELVTQEILFIQLDLQRYDDLLHNGKEAINKFPDNPLFFLLTGTAYQQKEKFELALQVLIQGEELSKSNSKLNAQFLASKGDVYYNLKQSERAFECYDLALKLDELNIGVLNNYSYYLSLEKKDLDKAERMSAKCVELEPGNATYLDTYAWVMFQRGRYFEAKYIIERAIDNGGDSSDVIVEHYGDILIKNGDKDGAIEQWKKAQDMGSTSKTLKKKIESGEYID